MWLYDKWISDREVIISKCLLLGGCLQPPVFKLCESLVEVFLTVAEDLLKRNNRCHLCVAGSLPRDTAHN